MTLIEDAKLADRLTKPHRKDQRHYSLKNGWATIFRTKQEAEAHAAAKLDYDGTMTKGDDHRDLGLLLLVAHRLFLVPILQHEIFSIN